MKTVAGKLLKRLPRVSAGGKRKIVEEFDGTLTKSLSRMTKAEVRVLSFQAEIWLLMLTNQHWT